MLHKCAILGLALLLAGGFAYGWAYHEARAEQQQAQNPGLKDSLGPEEYLAKYGRWYTLTPEQQNQLVLELDRDRQGKSKEQLAQEQRTRLRADRDKLAAGQMDPGDIADFLYGPGWQNEVEQYKKLQEQMEIAQTVSIVCLGIGGTVFGLCLLVEIGYLIVRLFRALTRRPPRPPSEPAPKAPELTDIELHIPAPAEDPESAPQGRPKQRRRVLTLAETPAEARPTSPVPQEPAGGEALLTSTFGRPVSTGRPAFGRQTIPEESAVAVLWTDEQTEEQAWSAEAQWSSQAALGVVGEELARVQIATPVAEPALPREEEVSVVENTLKEQAEDLQKQIAEFKQVAQDVQETTRQHSEPLSSTLKELAQQVSAIREYAACQQDRVEKLQDGYDWGIIRSFCVRVIRCLDNLESRISERPDEEEIIRHLEEIRDELLFALESSGVEQYRPEINREYRGQEKLAETIKEREPAPKPEQVGRIAKVIRPGYRYMIDDDNYKVVRTAQVKLFG